MQVHPERLQRHIQLISTAFRDYTGEARPLVLLAGDQSVIIPAVQASRKARDKSFKTLETAMVDLTGVSDVKTLIRKLNSAWPTEPIDPQCQHRSSIIVCGEPEKAVPATGSTPIGTRLLAGRATVLLGCDALLSTAGRPAEAARALLGTLLEEGASLLLVAQNTGSWTGSAAWNRWGKADDKYGRKSNCVLLVEPPDGTPTGEVKVEAAGRPHEPLIKVTVGKGAMTALSWNLPGVADDLLALLSGEGLSGTDGARLTFGQDNPDLNELTLTGRTWRLLSQPHSENSRYEQPLVENLLCVASRQRKNGLFPTEAFSPFTAPALKEAGVTRHYARAHETVRLTVQLAATQKDAVATAERFEQKSGRWVKLAQLQRGELPAYTEDAEEALRDVLDVLHHRVAQVPLSREPAERR